MPGAGLSRPPAKSRAAGRAMFFPHLTTPEFRGVPGTPYLIPSLGLGSARRPFGISCGSWLGSGLLPSENSAQGFFERRQKLLVAERYGLLVSTQEFDVLFPNDPREKPTPRWRNLSRGAT